MKFYGNPNELVVNRRKINGVIKNIPLFTFNEKGEYETVDEKLIEKLKQHFKYDEKHCKKCDFTCENQGELLSHYRISHNSSSKNIKKR
jgi:hypothetical protein